MTVHDVVAALTASPNEPAKVLVSGGIGTGKTSLVSAVRAALRDAAVAVIARSPREGDPAGAAVVIDDAHLLDDAELGRLLAVVDDPTRTMVVTAEPLTQPEALTALFTAMARQAPVVSLGALRPAEIARAAADALGSAPPAEVVRSVARATAGLPFLVDAGLTVLRSPDSDSATDAIPRATSNALIERLRRVDDAVLDALLISSLSQELGADDVAGALGCDGVAAHRLVDRARASGLISPSHDAAFMKLLHGCLAQLSGTTRHHEIERELLHTQIEKASLSMDVALRLADHGMRDERLADALTELAEAQSWRTGSGGKAVPGG